MKDLTLFLLSVSLLWGCRSKESPIQTREGEHDSFSIFGTWNVVDFKAGAISGIIDQEARKYVGTTIVLEPDSVVLIHDKCAHKVIYRIRTANAEEYLHFNYRTPPMELGLTEKEIRILEIYCTEGQIDLEVADPFYELIIYKNHYLIDSWNGYFFFLEK